MSAIPHPLNPTACAELFTVVYDDLQRYAAAELRRRPATHELQPDDLVHDAFLRVRGRRLAVAAEQVAARAGFFSAVARVIRDLLVENARYHAALKRGGPGRGSNRGYRTGLPAAVAESDPRLLATEVGVLDLLALDEVMHELRAADERLHEIVMLRFFAHLSHAEIAGLLQVCERTIERGWQRARTWLRRRLGE